MRLIAAYLPENGSVFEIGSASGRDARYLAAKGLQVTCTDVVPQALRILATQGFATADYDFRNAPKPDWVQEFDGVLASAVLLHAPFGIFEEALRNIALVLKPSGIAAISLKAGVGEEITLEKMDAPRYFRYYSKPEIEGILKALRFEILSLSLAEQGKWLHIIVKKQDS